MVDAPPAPTLDELIFAAGRKSSPRNAPVTELAAAAQRFRHEVGASDRTEVTRSTMLWALMTADAEVGSALASAGIDVFALGDMLKLSGKPPASRTKTALLDGDLAAAVRAHVETVTPGAEYGPEELAAAILQSAQDEVSGLLPQRLKELGVDPQKALYVLTLSSPPTGSTAPASSTAPPTSTAPPSSTAPPTGASSYSNSVRRARDDMGPTALVTPAAIAAAIQQHHPEYGGGLFGAATLRISLGRRATVDTWLGEVSGLYDASEVAATRHQVIDGELTVLGLAELDPSLAEDLRNEGALDALRGAVEVLPRPSTDRTGWSSDAPAVEDLLGRRYLARALATRLRARATDDSFLVHIDGPWGSGKSTLFNFLAEELESDSLLVGVNVWREQQVGVQWWTLHNALRAAVEHEAVTRARSSRVARVVARVRSKTRSRIDVVRVRLVPFVVAVLVLAAVVIGLFVLADFDLGTGAEIADSVAKVTSLALLAVGGVTAAYRFLLPESRRSAKAFVASSPNPMAEVRLLFQRTLRRTTRRVVFLIDDLDRCDAPYIVEFLSTMQTLLRDAHVTAPGTAVQRPGPCAFIAADGQWIRSSYESHYDKVKVTEVPGRPLGYLFLEKIFQLQVRLPSIGDEGKTAFYTSLLMPGQSRPQASAEERQTVSRIAEQVARATTGPDIARAARAASTITDHAQRLEVLGTAAVHFSELEIQDQTHHDLAPYARFMEPNPRSIRLFVNTYGTLQSLRTLEGVPVRTSPLARWTVIEIRWPLLADHLRARPDDIAPGPGRPVPPVIEMLLASTEVQQVIAGVDGEGLTPDDVRHCTGAVATPWSPPAAPRGTRAPAKPPRTPRPPRTPPA